MPNEAVMSEIQRTLGRLEQGQKGMRDDFVNGLRGLKNEFSDHKNDDQRNFSNLSVSLREEAEKREAHLVEIEGKIGQLAIANGKLQTQDENTKTIGKYIIGVFGTLVFMIGSAVIAALSGHIKIQ